MRSLLILIAIASAAGADSDRDGVDDLIEQRLLERFAPRFYIAADDCDGEPSSFERDRSDPVAAGRDGTLYGQAWRTGVGVEIHYYPLWAHDCGRNRHVLDAEYVAVLVREELGTWRPVAWYASAHEGTACDRSFAADGAGGLPDFRISAGKHAAYFSEEACARGGCGADRCANSRRWRVERIVNVGEPGDPLNGAAWTGSAAWPLRDKMRPMFTPELLARVEQDGSFQVREQRRGTQTTLKVATKPVKAVETAAKKTGAFVRGAKAAVESTVDPGLAPEKKLQR